MMIARGYASRKLDDVHNTQYDGVHAVLNIFRLFACIVAFQQLGKSLEVVPVNYCVLPLILDHAIHDFAHNAQVRSLDG